MIRLYSKSNCPFCDKAKAYLRNKNIPFEEVRVDLDPAAKEFLMTEGHRSVPQLYIGNELLVEGGYQGLIKLTEDELKGKLHAVE
jgi:glutaredoxin 3